MPTLLAVREKLFEQEIRNFADNASIERFRHNFRPKLYSNFNSDFFIQLVLHFAKKALQQGVTDWNKAICRSYSTLAPRAAGSNL